MIWKKNNNEEIPVAVKITNLNTNKDKKIKTFSRELRAHLLFSH